VTEEPRRREQDDGGEGGQRDDVRLAPGLALSLLSTSGSRGRSRNHSAGGSAGHGTCDDTGDGAGEKAGDGVGDISDGGGDVHDGAGGVGIEGRDGGERVGTTRHVSGTGGEMRWGWSWRSGNVTMSGHWIYGDKLNLELSETMWKIEPQSNFINCTNGIAVYSRQSQLRVQLVWCPAIPLEARGLSS
jgi:hypothetical protein